MTADPPPDDPPPNLGGEWLLDAEPAIEADAGEPVGVSPPEASGTSGGLTSTAGPPQTEVPPSPEQLVEAMLFVGGPPITAEVVCNAVRGLTAERFLTAIDVLTRRYRQQRRPYAVQPRNGGFVLALLPAHRGLRERLFGGPRETRLGQPALDVLSVVAYRQPVGKAEVDALRGTDSGAVLRQLVRLGLAAVQHRAEAGSREVRYGTTPRFLKVFGLASLDELPRLGSTESVSG